MADYRYTRLDMTQFILTTPEIQTDYSEFLKTIVDQPITRVNNTYVPFIIEKYNRNRHTSVRVAWVIFNMKKQTIELIQDPSNVVKKFLKNFVEQLEKIEGSR